MLARARPEQIAAWVEHAAAQLGSIDVLINNAGVVDQRPFGEITEAHIDRMMRVNVYGTLFCCQAAAEDMKRAPMVSLGYGLAMTLLSVLIAYSSWKFGTLGLYLGMASGFFLALFTLGSVREILGEGAFFGIDLFGPNFEPWVIMILPPGGFFVLGAWLLLFSWLKQRRERRVAQREEVTARGS